MHGCVHHIYRLTYSNLLHAPPFGPPMWRPACFHSLIHEMLDDHTCKAGRATISCSANPTFQGCLHRRERIKSFPKIPLPIVCTSAAVKVKKDPSTERAPHCTSLIQVVHFSWPCTKSRVPNPTDTWGLAIRGPDLVPSQMLGPAARTTNDNGHHGKDSCALLPITTPGPALGTLHYVPDPFPRQDNDPCLHCEGCSALPCTCNARGGC